MKPIKQSVAHSSLGVLFLALVLSSSGCGYHVAGHSSALPPDIHVIAIPAMQNATETYRIEQLLTAATVHEFLAKTPYKIVSNPNDGDAILRGKVLTVEAVPLLFNNVSGSATTMLVTVKCQVTLTDKQTEKVLYHNDNFLFRSEYEIFSGSNPNDIKSFFEEGNPALDRIARDFATRLVASVTENF